MCVESDTINPMMVYLFMYVLNCVVSIIILYFFCFTHYLLTPLVSLK